MEVVYCALVVQPSCNSVSKADGGGNTRTIDSCKKAFERTNILLRTSAGCVLPHNAELTLNSAVTRCSFSSICGVQGWVNPVVL